MSFLKKLSNQVLKSPILYVRLKKNEYEIKHIQTGNRITKKSPKPFSTERLLIADFVTAEEFLRSLCDELLDQKKNRIKKSIQIVFQPADDKIDIISPSEKRIYLDSLEHAGAKKAWIISHQNLLSDEEVLKITRM